MSAPSIEFWFEYGSTYTYLSVVRIGEMAAARSIDVAWKPFLLMPILAEDGMPDGPFLPFPKRTAYMWRDLERRAEEHGVPYRRPSVYPPHTLLTARIGLIAADGGWCEDFTRETFRRHWTEDITIGSDENIRGSLTAVGRNPDDVLARAQSDANKAALKAQTAAASERGIFGSPSFLIGSELFWGDDRLEAALAYAGAATGPAR